MNLRRTLLFVFLTLFLATPVLAAHFESDIKNGLVKRWSIETDHFRIEFSKVIKNQVDSDGDGIADLIELVAESSEDSWETVIDEMGYEEPIDDPDRKIVIILDDTEEYLSGGAVGITSTLSNGDPYVAIDPWLNDDYIEITLAHEFFHAVQFGYDIGFAFTNQGVNWAEATAVWMEDEVFNASNDYVNYLTDFFDYVDYSVFASVTPTDSLFEYALNIWPKFLSEYFDDDAIKDIWEEYFDSNLDDDDDLKVYSAVKEIVEDDYGDELWQVFQDFTLWNLDWEQYDEGENYPEVMFLEGVTGEYSLIEDFYAPALYGTNYLYFFNDDNEESFYFHVIKGEGVSFVVTLVPIEDGDADLANASSVFVDENEELTSEVILSDIGDADAVVAVVSPLDSENMDGDYGYSFDEGYLYYYLAQYGESIESEIEVDTEVDDGAEKEGDEVSGDAGARGEDELTLSLVSYDEDSVIFSWNRLVDEDVEGYTLYYEESGDLWHQGVDGTYGKISDLEEGLTYYFGVQAVDDEGYLIGEASNEIAVMPEEWIFTDLSYLDEYYDAVSVLVDEDVFEGYSDGSFGAGDDINRAELLKILIEAQGIDPSGDEYKDCFPDVKSDWYARYVCYAKEQDWIGGYPDNTFRPGNTVNKVEALKILFNVYEAGLAEGTRVDELPYDDLSLSAWYSIYVYEASELGILSETPGDDFNAENGRSRGEMAEELYRYLVVEDLIRE
jgi:hypothetical protein